MENIELICKELRIAKAQCDQADKEYAKAREALLKHNGENEFNGFGVTISIIEGKPYVDWSLAAPALCITDEMTKPFTKMKANTVRVTVERSVVI